ncbi:MAG: GNAT family N-acetyltransferase [Alphaproteobacteria bacterium]|nr:GNAT family N-acetyltransferase [Alphaproteobacteria bacterium]
MTTTTTIKINPILIDIPLPIETSRLLIRAPQAGDGPLVTEAKIETWDDLTRWMDWAKDTPNPEADEIVMREAQARFILRSDLMMLGFERASGKPVVFTGLHRINWPARIFEIGYWVRTSARGQGYATEAANALTRFAFQELAARKVLITHAADNEASAAVIRRLGYPLETIERYGTTLPDGRIVDQYRYARFDISELPDLAIRW